jgi:hypothetical protein
LNIGITSKIQESAGMASKSTMQTKKGMTSGSVMKKQTTAEEFSQLDMEGSLIPGEIMIRVRVTDGKVLTRVQTKEFPNADIAIAAKSIEEQLAALYAA